ncbi:MAG TPA: ribosome biogenesis GTP-binding protein YihA/YsxC [Polyangiaceae bacterium]
MEIPQVTEAEFLAAATLTEGLPDAILPEIAFAGRSNVGKSSLLNTMLSRNKLVRTSRTPGCTRQINLFRAKVKDGPELVFTDLPGFGYAKRSKGEKISWGAMIEGYLLGREALKALVLLVDVRRGVEEDDAQLVEFWEQTKKPLLIVATKLDKIPASKRRLEVVALGKASNLRVVGFSAESGEGRTELWKKLLAALA